MSRKPTYTTTVVKPNTATLNALPSDICPVCKRVRYLNTDMEFLINPECYHPMCSNCVNNIFKSGPAQCPYASCSKTLRIRGFRSAFFGDLGIEREVDIRRRVQAAFNQSEDDFETLRDYNNYLQDVEDLTFDLISGGDDERLAAEQKLLAREQHFKDEIERNKKRGRDAELAVRRRRDAEAEAARRRRAEELREDERARAEEATINAEVMEALSRGDEAGSAAEIQARIVARKRARVAEITGSHFPDLTSADSSKKNMLSIRGLKKKKKTKSDGGDDDDEDEDSDAGPYDPFGGLRLGPTRYEVRDAYENTWLEDAWTRPDHRVPGYSVQEYVARAMFDAFAGLGVVVDEDKQAPEQQQRGAATGTAGAAEAATANKTTGMMLPTSSGRRGVVDVDDVFG